MKHFKQITSYAPGSINELVMIALPLIVISLSENIMIFFDRIILAHYSLASLNAVTLASQAVEIFDYGLWAITSTSEIFIAASYARNQLKRMAIPCWQMIFLSLFMIPVVFIFGSYTGHWILPTEFQTAGLTYYKIIMYGVPLIGIVTAFSAFFVGQGKVKIVLLSTIAVNVINLILDFILIFGVGNVIPAMGAKGAALSEVISLLIQVIWLFIVYLNKYNRSTYATHIIYFNYKYLSRILKVGVPVALSHVCELVAWLFIIKMIAKTGMKNFTIISVGSTLYLIYAIIIDGLSRSVSTIISNHISAKNFKSISKTLRSGVKFLLSFLIILAVLMLVYPNSIIKMFNLNQYAMHWRHDIKISFVFILLYFTFSGLYWIYASVLTANQNTRFIMVSNILSIWVLTVLPIYVLVQHGLLVAAYIWPIVCMYALFGFLTIYIYYMLKISIWPGLSLRKSIKC